MKAPKRSECGETDSRNVVHMNENHGPVIRAFRFDDIDDVLEVERQSFPKSSYSKGILLHYAKALEGGFFVLVKEKEIIGYILFEPNGHIISTAVKKIHRRRGFGSVLAEYAGSQADKPLWLEVRSKNDGAIAFYKSLGMARVGRIVGYYGNDDALIMKMELGKSNRMPRDPFKRTWNHEEKNT